MISQLLLFRLLIFFWVFIFGLCFGSFLNVVILRGLSGESIVFPPSKCPKCGNKLKWWMNIPILSYIILKGKCGYCKAPISSQYPIVEFICGVFFVLIFMKFGISVDSLFYMTAFFLLMAMTVCDLKENVIIDCHAYILVCTGIAYNSIAHGYAGLLTALVGGIAGFIIYEVIARSGYLIVGQRAFGEGDSLIAAGIGAYFGGFLMVVSIVISFLVMGVFALPYLIYNGIKTGKKRTVIALSTCIVVIAALYFISTFELVKTFISSIIMLVTVIAIVSWCVKQIFSEINQEDESGEKSLNMMPFGPAMAISFMLIMFFKNNIINLVQNFLA